MWWIVLALLTGCSPAEQDTGWDWNALDDLVNPDTDDHTDHVHTDTDTDHVHDPLDTDDDHKHPAGDWDTDTPWCLLEQETDLPDPPGTPDLVPLVPTNVRVDEREVTQADCALAEHCVAGPGKRRLLRFDMRIANLGTGELAYGRPELFQDLFQFSLCHEHFHFQDFAIYDLRNTSGEVVRVGHKQAYCLTDSGRVQDPPAGSPNGPRHNCSNQGLSVGWYDLYPGNLDCQWVDITDLPGGDYVLRIEVDPGDLVEEVDDGNNVVALNVAVPDPDITAPCDGQTGRERECGWHQEEVGQCTPGDRVTVAIHPGDTCGGCTTEDPMLRVCGGADEPCLAGAALASSDNACGSCARGTFRCPESGDYTLWWARNDSAEPPTYPVHISASTPPPVTDDCVGFGGVSFHRECGWDVISEDVACDAGAEYWVGCEPWFCGLGACPGDDVPDTLDGMACEGDPVLRVCDGDEGPCSAATALSLADDGCERPCPASLVTCPASGHFTLLADSYDDGGTYTCRPGFARMDAIP